MTSQASYRELIERVKPHPEIWQYTHPLAKNKNVRLRFWRRLAKDMHMDEQQLRKNWKYLADQYRREYKKSKIQEEAVGEAVPSGWAHFEALSFLKPGMASKHEKSQAKVVVSSDSENNDAQETAQTTYSAFQDDNDDNYNDEHTWQNHSSAKQSKKGISKADLIIRKLQSLTTTIVNAQPDVTKNDEDYLFFMSVLPMFRTLSPLKKLHLRGKINDWMVEALSEREADPLNSVSHYAEVEPDLTHNDEDDKQALRDQIMMAEGD